MTIQDLIVAWFGSAVFLITSMAPIVAGAQPSIFLALAVGCWTLVSVAASCVAFYPEEYF